MTGKPVDDDEFKLKAMALHELVAYRNILTAGGQMIQAGDDLERRKRHLEIVEKILWNKYGITCCAHKRVEVLC